MLAPRLALAKAANSAGNPAIAHTALSDSLHLFRGAGGNVIACGSADGVVLVDGDPTQLRAVKNPTEIEGARCALIDRKVGTLTPGKEADIVMLRADTIDSFPLNNAYGAIVTGMDTSNIDTVMVAGKVVKRHGKLVGEVSASVADQDGLLRMMAGIMAA